jgi:hypothetical protein
MEARQQRAPTRDIFTTMAFLKRATSLGECEFTCALYLLFYRLGYKFSLTAASSLLPSQIYPPLAMLKTIR